MLGCLLPRPVLRVRSAAVFRKKLLVYVYVMPALARTLDALRNLLTADVPIFLLSELNMLPFLCWTDLDSMDRSYELAVGALFSGDSTLNLLLLISGEPPMGTNIEQRPNWLEEARGVSDIFPTLPYLT